MKHTSSNVGTQLERHDGRNCLFNLRNYALNLGSHVLLFGRWSRKLKRGEKIILAGRNISPKVYLFKKSHISRFRTDDQSYR